MRVLKCKNYEEVSAKAASIIIRELVTKPNAILGLATGTSPIGVYERLIEAYQKNIISFKDVKTYNLDEYVGIDQNHPQSYYQFMKKHLFDHVDIDEHNVFIPLGNQDDIKDLAEEYNRKLFGNQRDLQLLGIGSNGHIGFNEPGSYLGNQTFVVKLDDQTRKDNSRFFGSLDEVPTHAITMGIKNIMYSKQIVLIASGESKSEAIYKMIYGKVDEDIPASILQLHPNITVIVDEAAAKLLNMSSDTLTF